MRKFHLPAVVGFCFLFSLAYGQTRLAYVDSEKILDELPEAKKARNDLEQVAKVWRDSLQQMSDEFQKALEDYRKREAVMPQTTKDAQQKILADLQQRGTEYQMKKFDTRQGELAVLQEKKMAPIREKIFKVIENVAHEDGYNFVFNKQDVLLLYADAKYDLTYKVLDRLKRGAAGAKSK